MGKDATLLRIIELSDGRWKFDLKAGMNDDELRALLRRIKVIEKEVSARLTTDIVQATDTVAFIIKK